MEHRTLSEVADVPVFGALDRPPGYLSQLRLYRDGNCYSGSPFDCHALITAFPLFISLRLTVFFSVPKVLYTIRSYGISSEVTKSVTHHKMAIKQRRYLARKANERAAQNRNIEKRMAALDSAKFTFPGRSILISARGAVYQAADLHKVVLSI